MAMIGQDDLAEFDERLRSFYSTLLQSSKPAAADVAGARVFLSWVIYPDWEAADELDVRPIEWSDGLNPEGRQALVDVVRTAAAMVKSSRGRGKEELLAACQRLLKLRGVQFGDSARSASVDRETDARDKFIYQKVMRGTSPKQILNLVGQHPQWDLVGDEVEILEHAVEYARRHRLPMPRG
jgi:hypothetical protein